MTAPSDRLAEIEAMRARKDAAYAERNRVVAALAKLFPSGVARTNIEGWSDDWHGCVYIDLPTGQVSWHFHDSQADLFADLPPYPGKWDGHDTDEKYRRLAALSRRAPAMGDDGLRNAIQQAIEWFQQYADGHKAKGADDKAIRNQVRADMLRSALRAAEPPAAPADVGAAELIALRWYPGDRPALVAAIAAALQSAATAATMAERERCAKVAEAMCPAGGRQWSVEQLMCFTALTECAAALRAAPSASTKEGEG